ncbi:MAG: protein-tyrosine kinase [Eubacterium sp.]|nr:protein-tyrosine kinase [Eubacterium sp.]
MDAENSRNEIEIDLRGLFTAILNRMMIIILVGILVGGIVFAYTEYFVDEQYVAKTKVYILTHQDPNSEGLTTNDLAFATYLANDYQVLLTSDPVLQEVIDELDLEQSTDALADMISVELIEDTRVMEISVTSTDPKLAQKIANKVRDVANEKTKNVMEGIEAVNAIDEAKLPQSPSSPNVEKNTMLGFVLGFGLSVIVVVIMFILDDTIKSPDDIEKYLGLSVLAAIPLKSADSKSGYGYGYGYGYGHRPEQARGKTKEPDGKDEEPSK